MISVVKSVIKLVSAKLVVIIMSL